MPYGTSNPILLVNAREADLLALEAALIPLGLTLSKTKSAIEALRFVDQHPVALALVALHLPDMDGIELVRVGRQTRDKYALPVLLVGPDELPPNSLKRIYELGAADFLRLPAAPEVLRGRAGLLLELGQRGSPPATRLEANALVAAQQDRFRLLADAASDYGLFFTDAVGTVNEWTVAAEHLFGYTAREAVGQNGAFIFTPEDRARGAPEAEITVARQTGQARDDRIHMRKDGSRFPASGRLVALRHANGELHGFAKIVRDATTLAALQESERKFRQIFETANEGIWLLDAESKIEIANPRLAEMLGYEVEQIVGRHKTDFCFPEDCATIEQLFAERKLGKATTTEVRFRHRNGQAVWTLMSARPRYQGSTFVGALDMFTDITGRRAAEERFRLFFESSAAGHALLDPQTRRFLDVNRRFCEIVGRSREELLRITFTDITHPDDLAADEKRFDDLLRGRTPEVNAQKRYLRPDGSVVWVQLTSTTIRDERNVPKLQLSVVQDITELKRVETELTDSRTRLRLAIEAAHLGVFFRDGVTGHDTWNEHARQMLGVAKDTPASLDVLFARVHPEDMALVQSIAARLLDPSNPAEEFGVDFRVVLSDGTSRYLSAHGITTPPGPGQRSVQVIGTVCDVTAMKDLEQELRRKVVERTRDLEEKTKQLESFSYTVAHDLRAPLRSINGYAELLIDEIATASVETRIEILEQIKAATRRLDVLIRDLMAYSRIAQVDIALERVDLETAIQRALRELRPEIERRHATVHASGHAPGVRAEKTIVEHAVLNLLSNALKFVRPGEAPVVDLWTEEHDRRVILNVRDRGIGIPPEYHRQVFKVFERLQVAREYPGTGIGLAIVAKGMERIGGEYGLQSTPGQGSTFWISMQKAES